MNTFPTRTLMCAGTTLALAATLSAPALADPGAPQQSLSFTYSSATIKDDPSYGRVVDVTFDVTNTGASNGPFSFHPLDDAGRNFIDAEGEEMYTGCSSAISGLRPSASTTCHSLIRLSNAEVAAGHTQPQPMTFQWGSSGPTFPGFTVPSLSVAPPAPVERKSLAFEYVNSRAVNDPSYGPALEVTFSVENTGNTMGPWEFHALTAHGENFLDDEGQEMYTGCQSAISQLQPGGKTTCRTFMRLSQDELRAGTSSSLPVTFRWGSTGPSFPGFTVPSMNVEHVRTPASPESPTPSDGTSPTKPTNPTTPAPTPAPSTTPTPTPATPTDTSPASRKPSPTSDKPNTPGTPAPSPVATSRPGQPSTSGRPSAPTSPASPVPTSASESSGPGSTAGETATPSQRPTSGATTSHATTPETGPVVQTDQEARSAAGLPLALATALGLTTGAGIVVAGRRLRK